MNFKVLLGAVMSLFVVILIVCYFIARDAQPVFLDEHGQPSTVAKPKY